MNGETKSGGPSSDRHFLSSRTILVVIAACCLLEVGAAAWRGRSSMTSDQILVFELIPFGMALALLALSRARAVVRQNALLAMTSLTLTVLGVEVVLDALAASPATARLLGGRDMWSPESRLETIRAYRAEGRDAFPVMPGQALKTVSLDDGRIQPLTPTAGSATAVLCRELVDVVAYESDELGFNNPAGLWAEGAGGVVAIGDSYVHGVCVNPGEGVADRLRAEWPGLVNVGVMGAGPLTQLGILKEYVAHQRPERVLWFFYEGNDLVDIGLEEQDDVLPRYLEADFSQGLWERRDEVDGLMRAHLDSLVRAASEEAGPAVQQAGIPPIVSQALSLRSLRSMAGIQVLTPNASSPLGVLPEVLAEAERTIASWGGELTVVYLPAFQRYHSWIGDAPRGRPQVLAAIDSLGIPVIDLVPVLAESDDPRALWAHPAGHFTPEGYRLVAEAVIDGVGASR